MIKLDIGSGQSHNDDGWLGVDPFSPTADVRAYMWDLPYDNNSVDEIFTSHALEHIGKFQIIPTLNEWYRIIVPGGKITIRVPDLEWCVRHWLEHKESVGWDLDVIFGNQMHDGEFHKTGFTEHTLMMYVSNAKLRITKFEVLDTHSQKTLSLECTK
ncbi:MAG: methyltransferase domain-containing protein [Richelia sp. SL_2_1]|nr:methyltransferase domain-containing protein [Richelia sp. SL_2_1]